MSNYINNITKLNDWHLISSNDIEESGSALSSTDIDLSRWYESEVPSTVLASLVKNGVYNDPYFGNNLEKILTEQFKIPWWYRTEFKISKDQTEHIILLEINGLNYKANIWLNGELVVGEGVIKKEMQDLAKEKEARNIPYNNL